MTISECARKFGLSRSTLLYYERIGLLAPSGRNESNYRIYTTQDARRLEKICLYRKAGVELNKIRQLLESPDSSVWEERLIQLNNEMNSIRIQQKLILEVLQNPGGAKPDSLFNAQKFSQVLKSLGLTDSELFQFHVRLEMDSSAEHRNFLHFLGLGKKKADKIIEEAKEAIKFSIND